MLRTKPDTGTAHTESPWQTNGGIVRTVDENGITVRKIATVHGEFGEAEKIANARLIAAAPELLSVAKETLELAELATELTGCRGDDDYVWGIRDRLIAAIAKAEGRS